MTTVASVSPAVPQLPGRANSMPLPNNGGTKPELGRAQTAPAALNPPKAAAPAAPANAAPAPASAPANWFKDTFSRAGSSVKGWHDNAVKTATADAQASGTKLGGAKAGLGVAGGLAGIGINIKGLVDGAKDGDGSKIGSSALGLGHGVLATVKGGLDVAASIEAFKGAGTAAKAGGTAAKIAGRFTPGLNIALAGVDTAIAARNLADPKASVASKVTSSITAAGSIAAATNIPVVSQVGAAVSTISSITGAALDDAKSTPGAIVEGGNTIADTLGKVGSKIKGLFK